MSYDDAIPRYLDELAERPSELTRKPPPSDALEVAVVIPAYDELDRIASVIESLDANELAPECAEIAIVVNNSTDADEAIVRRNIETLERLDGLETRYPLRVLDRCSPGRALPEQRSGVGWARRIGMDFALDRLHQSTDFGGIIACLDGDSPADPGYLDRVVEAFDNDDDLLAGVCRYRHPTPDDPDEARAIVRYETWMRYFELGLHVAGTPYAFQSIGSCMVVAGRGYALADGVPTREALSDFYLLQKIVKAGGRGAVRQLTEPMVRPAPRPSDRVPRGTGPSVRASLTGGGDRFDWSEPPEAFLHLRRLFEALPEAYDHPDALRSAAAPPLESALEDWNGWKTVEKLRRNSPDASRFRRHFHEWFDSLKIVKYANRRRRTTPTAISEALPQLLDALGHCRLADRVPAWAPDEAALDPRLEALQLLRENELRWHTLLEAGGEGASAARGENELNNRTADC